MLRIGEFVELSSISINMLRHYDKIGLLVPRYIDELSGYRYYDKEQLVQANQIIALKEMGFGLEEIKSIIMQEEKDIHSFFSDKLKRKYDELDKIARQIDQIKTVLNFKEDAKGEYSFQIIRKEMHPMWIVGMLGQIDSYAKEGLLWEKLSSLCANKHIKVQPNANAMAIYKGLNEDTGKIQIEVQFSVEKEYKDIEPLSIYKKDKMEIASIIFKGNYKQIASINTSVASWLENNNLEICGETFTIYHKSPGDCKTESDFITELCIPIKEKYNHA